jgi:hypothetical protein
MSGAWRIENGSWRELWRVPDREWALSALMLICAVLASLALGVLVAYGICQMMFRVFRVHSMVAAQQREVRKAAAGVQIVA